MSSLSRKVIIDNWNSLIEDLQEDVILDSKSILTEDEFETINDLDNDQQMIEHFLNAIIRKSIKELHVFIESLRIYYPWLYTNLNNTIDKYRRTVPLHEVKMLGGIPNLPQRIVERTDLLNKLKISLKKLNKGEYIVLHGMLGCGKTTLAAAALNDYELIKTYFKGSVYWLTVGKVGKEDLGFLQQQLNERFPDPVQLSPSSHLATIQLTKMLIEKGLCDNLIVLDDVKDKMVLDCFAIGAKFLVITEDKGVIGNQSESSVRCIKVDEGFTLDETLELFSKSLNVKNLALPRQASDIHNYTKGHPLTISLIACQLENYRDSVMKDGSRWDHYVKMLSNKNRRRSFNDLESFYNAMGESVESLEKNKIFFQQLAVFVKDVNIKPEVLGVLWKMDKFDAEALMVDFVKKSLAVMKWNELQDSYVYGVHDLVSDFLKKNLSKSEEQELHKNFILNYKAECQGIWSNLPKNDNYIFYYIGYHLRKAGGTFLHIFKSLYFDLPFLEAKLRVCGPADLIQDYKTYKELITNQSNELKKKAEEFCTFIEYHGISIANGISIIQAALQEPTTSSIHVAAVHLAKNKKCKELYLHSSPLSEVDRIILPDTLEINEEINIVCFGRTTNEAIIAFGPTGKTLRLYNIRAKGVLEEYIGHTNKITSLDVSNCKTLLLSSSMDNTIRVWSLENGKSTLGDRSPSPTERQLYFMNLFSTTPNNGAGISNAVFVLKHCYPVLWSVFSKKDSSLIASLGPANISIWKSGQQKWEIKYPPSSQFRCLDFLDEQFVAAGGCHKIVLYLLDSGTKYQQINYDEFISLRSLPVSLGGGLVILTKDRLTLYSQTAKENCISTPLSTNSFKQLHCVGTHIAITTECGELFVFHFFTGANVYHIPLMTRQLNSVCVNDKAILLGYSNGSLYLNPLDGLLSPLSSIKWRLNNQPVLIKMDHSKENIELVIGKEKKIIAERSTKIKLADISTDGKIIILVYEDGRIAYKKLDEEHDETIVHESTVPIGLNFLEDVIEKFVVVFYENKETLLWKVTEKKLVKLNDTRSIGCSSASFLNLGNYPCILTTSPMTIWDLLGRPIDCMLSGIHQSVNAYCVRPDLKTFVYAVADKTWLVDSLHSEINLNMKSSKLLAFSPSGKILAALSQKGILTIFDCLKKSSGFIKEIPDNSTCLAVSDSGSVCIGGSNHLSIFTQERLSSKIFLNTRSVVAKPNGEDKFAVADSSGVVYIVYLDVINGEEEISMSQNQLI